MLAVDTRLNFLTPYHAFNFLFYKEINLPNSDHSFHESNEFYKSVNFSSYVLTYDRCHNVVIKVDDPDALLGYSKFCKGRHSAPVEEISLQLCFQTADLTREIIAQNVRHPFSLEEIKICDKNRGRRDSNSQLPA